MAVPPDVAKAVIEAVLKTYAGVQYDAIPSKWTIDPMLSQHVMELVGTDE